MLTHVTSTSVFRRSYWWRKKSNDNEKSPKGSESEKKTEKKNAEETPNNQSQTAAVDRLKELSESMNTDSIATDLGKFGDSLLRSDVRADGLNDLPDAGPLSKFGQNTFKSFQDFIAPRPLRLHNERIMQSSPDRYVGLFLRKAKSSNDLVDKPDVIKSLDDIFPVGT